MRKLRWVVVELESNVGYGEDCSYEYKTIGRVYGPYSKEDAEELEKKLNRQMGRYSDFEVREMER